MCACVCLCVCVCVCVIDRSIDQSAPCLSMALINESSYLNCLRYALIVFFYIMCRKWFDASLSILVLASICAGLGWAGNMIIAVGV